MPKVISIVYACTLLISISSYAWSTPAKEFIVGGYDYPPFMDSRTKTGIYHHLMQEIALETGYIFNWKYFPYARLNSLFEQGDVHIEVGSSPDWVSGSSVAGIFTQSFYTLEDIAVFQPDQVFRIKKPIDIQNKVIGVVRGYGFKRFDHMFNAGKAKRSDANDESHLLDMLYHKRMTAIFINKDVLKHHIKHNPKYRKLTVGDSIGLYDVGLRIHPRYKAIISTLNQAIESLKRSGKIPEIVNKAFIE